MNPSPEEALFQLALAKPAEKRPAFLDAMCEGDAALRARLEALLAAHEQPATELAGEAEATVKAVAGIEPLDEAVGQTLGRYKLLERVGEGGCGVVYVAEQTEPVRRRVALKVIKLGMDTKQVVARFEAERQALAMMDHPNIAKVLDAGTTGPSELGSSGRESAQTSPSESQSRLTSAATIGIGRPYFVMELVRGIKITDYCDQVQLSTKERLDLFIKVCQAIQHAHQKGIIHRDIKPSNILVTLHDGVPVPKVIDFGIAKATEGRLTDATVYTQLHQFIGTPAYMSPEQAEMSGLDIDTRSDIYSLGVLLYELLAGSTPFDAKELMASGIDAMRKTIREKEPVRPSTKLSQTLVAANVSSLKSPAPGKPTTEEEVRADSRRLLRVKETIHQLKGDLDWIVMKCLEKDRQRRYDTANGLAADLKRHLDNEPVQARPPSTAYRFQKAFRRNKLAFTAAAAVVAALIAGLGLSLWQYAGKSRAEREQVTLRLQAEATAKEASRAREQASQQRDLARERLYGSLVREAQSISKTRRVGYRREVFDRLKQATALGITNADTRLLRREAASSLGDWVALDPVDIEVPDGFGLGGLTPDGTLAALVRNGTNIISLRETRTGREVASLETAGIPLSLAFDQRGLTLFVATVEKLPSQGERPKSMHLEKWAGRSDGSWKREWSRSAAGLTQLASTDDGPVALLLGPSDSYVAVIDLERDVELARVAVNSRMQPHPALEISADRRRLAFFTHEGPSGFDDQLEVWDLVSGKQLADLKSKLGYGIGLSFGSDGKTLAATYQSALVVYDAEQFGRLLSLEGIFDDSWGAVIAGNTGLIAVPIAQEFAVQLINLRSGREVAFLRQSGFVRGQFFNRDGSVLVLTHSGGGRIVHLKAEREKLSLAGHQGGVPVVEFSPDGKQLASAGKDRTLRLWDLSAPGQSKVLGRLPAPGQTLAYTPDGAFLVCGYYNTSELSVWSLKSGERVRTIPQNTNYPGTTWGCAVSPDGKHLATIGGGLRVWDMAALTRPAPAPGWIDTPLLSDTNSWGSVAFDPAGKHVAYKGQGSLEVLVQDLDSKGPPSAVATNLAFFPVQVLGYLPKSGALAYITRNSEVAVIDPSTGQMIRRFPTRESAQTSRSYVENFLVSPDESKLAVITASGLGVDLLEPATGKLLHALPEEPGTIWWLAWSPDSQQLAVTRANGEIALWHLKEVEAQLAQLGLQP